MDLPFALDRTVLIRASRATVFSFFTDSARFASWWGEGSTIEPREGGAVRICYPGGVIASGVVLELQPDRRIVFSYGYEGPGQPIAPGGSRVTIELRPDPRGTELELRHEVADAAVRDEHVQGWRYQLSVFAHVASNVQHQGIERRVDAWFAAWNDPDQQRRAALLADCCRDDVTFRDRWSALDGRADLVPHIGAALQFLPGIAVRRTGAVRHCQGTALCDWEMHKGDQVVAAGTNVFELSPDGAIASVVGVAAAGSAGT